MKGAAALALLLAVVHLSCPCDKLDRTLVCRDVPSFFEAGCLYLFMSLQHVGVINSTVFKSDNLSSVTKFIISNAGVTGIVQNAFSSFRNLTDINLEGNMLSQINTNWFGDPAGLSRACLTANRIEVVNASTLTGFTNLTHLQLNKNRIKSIHPNGFMSQSMLAQLDLSQNRLTWISPQVFRSLRSLRSIGLNGNPWNCSCDAEDFVASIKGLHSRSQLDRQMEVTCESPPPLKGQPVWNVSVCPTSPSTTASMTTTTNPPTPPTSSGTNGTLSPSDHRTSVQLSTGKTSSKPAGMTDAYLVCTLVAVIAVLCVLLFSVCFLLHRRKRSNKTVMPGLPREEKRELEDDKSLSRGHSPGSSADTDPEVARRRSFPGVRAKSANAVILTSSFGLSGKDPPSGEGEQKLGTESEAQNGAEGGIQMDNLVAMDPVKERDGQDDGRLGENVNADLVPYLSIGTAQSKISPDEESTEHPGRTPQWEKVLGRISTWPPTAPEWQVRCKSEEDGEGQSFAVWTQKAALKLSGEVEKIVNNGEDPTGSDQREKEDETEAHLKRGQSQPVKTNEPSVSEAQSKSDSATEERVVPEPATGSPTSAEICGNQEEESPGKQLENVSSAEGRTQKNLKRVGTGRRRAERGAASSKVTSGGTSPDDETLLSGNSYAFMDLLHEVTQNNGRWTRERWKRLHANKQRR